MCLMACELCGMDLLFRGAASRCIEGLNICLDCFLRVSGSGYGEPTYRALSLNFLRYGAQDTRRQRWGEVIDAA